MRFGAQLGALAIGDFKRRARGALGGLGGGQRVRRGLGAGAARVELGLGVLHRQRRRGAALDRRGLGRERRLFARQLGGTRLERARAIAGFGLARGERGAARLGGGDLFGAAREFGLERCHVGVRRGRGR